jgi:hypothetical protein
MAQRRPYTLAAIAASALVVTGLALGRQHALQPLSATDLAFFHQSAWSAWQGYGFAQTVLSFDGQRLLGCVHLSPIRLLFAPLTVLGLGGLVALQALAMASAAWAGASLARGAGASRSGASLAALVVGLHPLTVTLAVTDLRPLVFLAPAVLWLAVAVQRGRLGWGIAAGLCVLCTREEAILAPLALLPFALGRRDHRSAALLGGLSALGVALLYAAWGQLSSLPAGPEPLAELAAMLDGSRPVFDNGAELVFLLLCLLTALPALFARSLLIPGLLAWLWLLLFSNREPVDALGAGVHYLAVAHPFVLGAVAVGLGRAQRRVQRWRGGRWVALGLAALTLASLALQGPRGLGWIRALVAPPDGLRAARALLDAPLASGDGVLCDPAVAPTLAGREGLWVQGEVQASDEAFEAVLEGIAWAVLRADAPEAAEPGALERRRWRGLMEDRGMDLLGSGGELELWGSP